MNSKISLKSTAFAAVIAAALGFGITGHAQPGNATPSIQMEKDGAQQHAETKQAKQVNKKANKATASPSGTNAEASKLGDASKPVSKGDGKN